MSTDFMSDPFWYKDAVIYELHVRSFYDSNNDGYGDFEGMRAKLPYLESLGVNTLWLLPFLKSPLKDDGYDTSDYYGILPVHGTMDDFRAFLDESHERGMRVITELVLNHTSDQHPWFQQARDPDSPMHDWYVWSETTEKYADARIIFTDTEISNWTWDRAAGKYYWHRFFSHQPDLNYDNPEVRQAMKEAMFFWLDMGVDGLRLDAVPYLYEREGTSCENLPETIDYIVELRKEIEDRYGPGRVLLAEANQWPEDTLPYFADGDGVQMAFNFPIMPRMYMALRRENRRPIVEMLALTKDIPEDAQWAIFLRNHDELTLEMVTDEERDYMYHEYAADSRFRINVGIRRRLAPLLGSDRRRIELMNALLLSLKGSPVIYYGDEIGMGDDPFLGDRNGVRTPMQWSPDKNGGFSRAAHHELFMPSIDRGQYSYEFVNVEDAERNAHSLLNYMKRLLALRKKYNQVFGRGSMDIVPTENQRVLAFVREYEGTRMLVVANLSRFAQSVQLPQSDFYEGMTPTELFGQSEFPAFGADPYHMILAPHGFFWFLLEPEENIRKQLHDDRASAHEVAGRALPLLRVPDGLENLLIKTLVQERGMERLQKLIPDFLRNQRWFGARESDIKRVTISDAFRLQAMPRPVYVSIVNVALDNRAELYVLPLTLSSQQESIELLREHGSAAIAWVETPNERSLLHDATVLPDFWLALFRWWQRAGRGRSLLGVYSAAMNRDVQRVVVSTARLLSGEQSNSAAIIEGRYFVKLYRRLEEGINPETELLDYLTRSGFQFVPSMLGKLSFHHPRRKYTLGIAQQALEVEEDGWDYTIEIIDRFLDRVAELAPPQDETHVGMPEGVPGRLEELAPEVLSLVRLIGIRTAELHLAFADADEPDLRPEAGEAGDVKSLAARVRSEAALTRQLLADYRGELPVSIDAADWEHGLQTLSNMGGSAPARQRIRIHGDFHLGQIILASGEVYILDFEGEPDRSNRERRNRDHALRDVAGMLRSFEYAAHTAMNQRTEAEPEARPWIDHLMRWSERIFLHAYVGAADGAEFAQPSSSIPNLLWMHLVEKAMYEVRYELNHRPAWVGLPLHGLKRLLAEPDRLHATFEQIYRQEQGEPDTSYRD